MSEMKLMYCSFCGKENHEVEKLWAGPIAFICNECIDVCNAEMINDYAGKEPKDKKCGNCRFWKERPPYDAGLCRRYPRIEQKVPLDGCGEWKA